MKNLPWYIAAAAVIALVIVLLSQCGGGPAGDIGYIKDSTQHWKNKYGQLVASLKQREQDFAVSEKGYLDSIAKLHNGKARDIKAAIELRLKGKTKITAKEPVTIEYDLIDTSASMDCPPSIKSIGQVFSSPYYVASAVLYTRGDSSTLDLTTYDTLTVVTKQIREGNIFHRRHYIQVDARNANPYNIIEGMKVYRLPAPRPKKFGIGPQLGVTLDGSGQVKPYAGIGVQYSIIRL